MGTSTITTLLTPALNGFTDGITLLFQLLLVPSIVIGLIYMGIRWVRSFF